MQPAISTSRATYRLLIVDDDEAFRVRVGRAMERRSYSVLIAGSVAQAQVLAEAEHFTHALVDLRMPGGSGLSLLPVLRQSNRGMRIVVLTGYGSIPTTVEAMRLGADDFLTKPVDAEEINLSLLGLKNTTFSESNIPSLARVEWEHMQRVLNDCNHNISQAARELQIERKTLQRKLKKYPPNH